MNYLAYGSNLLSRRLLERAPSARVEGVARLTGWELRFHKRGRIDGSGKCDLVRSPASVSHGVVWRIAPEEKRALDRAEGLGNGYRTRRLRLEVGGKERSVFTYLAEASHIVESLPPFRWYLDLVIAGAREHGLPADYTERLQAVHAVADPDSSRAARHRRLLHPATATDRIRRRPRAISRKGSHEV